MLFFVYKLDNRFCLSVTDPIEGCGHFHPEKKKLFPRAIELPSDSDLYPRGYNCWRQSLTRLLKDAEKHFGVKISAYQYTDYDKEGNQKTETISSNTAWGESDRVPNFCECDNGHEQNDTVCRFCYSHGRRKWNDPEVEGVTNTVRQS